MTKKEYVITILTSLIDSRPLASGLLQLVQSGSFDDEAIDGLTKIFQETLATITDREQRSKLQHAMSQLDKLKALEAQTKQVEAGELSGLEELLTN